MFQTLSLTILFEIFIVFTKQESLPNILVSDSEIINLVNKFYSSDKNAAGNGEVIVNYQGHTTLQSTEDFAPLPLFKKVDNSIKERPTYRAYIELMDNYTPEVGTVERTTSKEKQEINSFLNLIANTTIGNEFLTFLKEKNHPYAKNKETYFSKLKQLWFDNYSRARGILDSSGFEHVFIGEIKNNEVSGFHNWFRFYYLEANANQRNFDYKGFIVKRFNTMTSVKFSWKGYLKKSGSFFISTSPEYDFFVYTLCFLFREGSKSCNIEVNGCPASITAHKYNYNDKIYIGSLFPSIGQTNEKCRMYNADS